MRRRFTLVVLALACAPVASAADLTVKPRDFSPDEARLRIQAALPKPERVGLQLATLSGRPLGWIVEPQRRRFLTLRWNARLRGIGVPDGNYRIRLVVGQRELASSPLRIDRIAPRVTEFDAHTRSRTPFAGDSERLTTISPNGDGLRDAAKISFTLSERARVRFEVTRTVSAPQTIYELTANLRPGRKTFTWHPPKATGARTYLVRITTTDGAGNSRTYGADDAREGRRLRSAVVRVLGVDAGFMGESYVASSSARLAIETDAKTLTLQTFRAGPEDAPTHSDTIMNGVAVNPPVTVPWSARHRRATLNYAVGPWPSGVYFVKLSADDGRIGYAPFVVRPTVLGSTSRVAVVMPTNTWQGYNFRDADGNGWGDTWYAKGAQSTAELGRPFIRRGVPPQWRKYDVGFLRWLHSTGKQPELLTESDLETIRTAEELIRLYNVVIFPGHTEYATRHEFDLIRNYRDLGGNLAFLSANNFFWEVRREGRVLRRTRLWRDQGRPESAVLGVQYRANDDGRIQRPFVVRAAATVPWFYDGTGLGDGSSFGQELGGYGIEIDSTTSSTPAGTIVLAEVPDLYGPGLTAQMTYYETPQGAKVFSAGTIDFGGTARLSSVHRMLENLWARLAQP
ncbi:MAG: N,N-dimethylformamidase beta subunit family domain-containing protein [Gaiellaceae bacterium]